MIQELLARPGIVRAVAPHDAFTARIAADAGAELLFLGGFGVAASALGLPDLGLASLTEMAEAARRITAVVETPLIVDGDTGHGEAWHVARTVRELERAGAAGVLLEDQRFPKRCGHFTGKEVVSAREMIGRLRAALDARRDPRFVIIARTDARALEGLDAALERQAQYAETGVDLGFVEAPGSRDELARIPRETTLPQLANMLVGGATPILSAEELEQLGFKIMVDPIATLAATGWGVRRAIQEYLRTGRVDATRAERLEFDEIKRLLRLPEILATGMSTAMPAGEPGAADEPWRSTSWVARTQVILNSFRRWLGRELIERTGDPLDESRRLYEAPRVVVAHGTQEDPLLDYANAAAVTRWETTLPELLGVPSRLTAEPLARPDRQRLLDETRARGCIENYAGVRISRRGKRFRIEGAVVWNLVDEAGQSVGQAATFDAWTDLA